MTRSATVFFYCNALDEAALAERRITTDSPAATRKVASLCDALDAAGVRPVIISMGRGRTPDRDYAYPSRCGRIGKSVVIYGPLRSGWRSLPLTALWLSGMALRFGRARNAVHLFYNPLVLYLPALCLLRALNARTALDLEDGPVAESRPEHRGNASDRMIAPLINSGALLACGPLSDLTAIRPTLPVYGAIPEASGPPAKRSAGRSLHVLYSGSIEPETGSDILLQAVEILSRKELGADISIHVTGSGSGLGSLAEFEPLAGRSPIITVHGRLPLHEYRELLSRCEVGLSLKLASGVYAQTTFPSKTIEYASNALAIISTDISDVRSLFGDEAIFLDTDSPDELATRLLWCAEHAEARTQIAKRAYERVRRRLSYPAVGNALKSFFFRSEPS